jgi:hypothetical protein
MSLDEMAWLAEDGRAGDALFAFAAGVFGDAILYSAREADVGAILLADHESDGGLVVLETSLVAWLDRLIAFDGVEYACVTGELPAAPPEVARRFLARHLTLNPGSEWAARQMMNLDYPGGHPRGALHWDATRHTLVPIGEAGPVEEVTIHAPSQRELESVASAGRVRRLMIVGGAGLDLSCLGRQSAMRSLSVYDVPVVDAGQLEHVAGLEEVYFTRCEVRRLDRLAGIAALKRVRIPRCEIDEAELDRLRGLRSNPRLGIER